MQSPTRDNPSASIDLSEYKGLFLEQAELFLVTLRQSLVQLENDPMDEESFREGRRAAHTLKGMAATMHYEDLASLGKRLESEFLHESPLTPQQIKDLLAGCDEFGLGLERLNAGDEEQSA